MTQPHGGYRAPANPAAVSGPGALSARTDGQQPAMPMTGGAYGEASQMQAIQTGAPMAGANPIGAPTAGPPGPGGPPAPGGAPGPGMATPQPLTAGSLLPDMPVTHGADSGPGPDSSSLGLQPPDTAQYQTAYTTLQSIASSPTASPATKALMQALQGGY